MTTTTREGPGAPREGRGAVLVVGAGPGVGAAVARRCGRAGHPGTAAPVGRVLPSMRAAGRGTLLFTTGSAVLKPNPERATSGVVNAAQATYFQMLHDKLGPEGIYALHSVIVGPIGPGGHDPDDIAAAMWDAADARREPRIVIDKEDAGPGVR